MPKSANGVKTDDVPNHYDLGRQIDTINKLQMCVDVHVHECTCMRINGREREEGREGGSRKQ